MREGPSSLSFMTTGIPLEILKRHVTIIVGTSDIYRNLYVSHNKHMIAELTSARRYEAEKLNDEINKLK